MKVFIYISIILFFVKCAQIAPLTGGKRDTTPPKALTYLPKNASVNFNQKKIRIEFDEYIGLKNLINQFVITPQTKEFPLIEARGKILELEFKEELLPNTTYKLYFGNAIVDNNENNAIPGFEYVFSTGAIIDTFKIKGHLISAENNKPVANILIGLYPGNSEDSIIYKQKPIYISKTNQLGNFLFDYLPNTNFKIIAIKDDNKNLVYDGTSEEIGFLPKNVLSIDTSSIQMKLSKEALTKQFLKKIMTNEFGKATLIYNVPCNDLIKIEAKQILNYSFNPFKDSLTLYYGNTYDTLKTIIHYKDHLNDTIFFKIPSKNDVDKIKNKRELKYILKTNFNHSIPYFETLCLELNMPHQFEKLNRNDISLFELKDTLKIKQAFEIIKNEKKQYAYNIITKLKEDAQYALIVNKGAFKDDNGRINDSLNYKFTTTSEEDYGKLNLKLTFPKKENYLILLLNENGSIVKNNKVELSLTSSSTQQFDFKNLLPGNYFIKIVEDANKNSLFDVGNYLLNIQPEIIYYNETPVKILAGWEIENEWQVK
jgi:hypothetical protein